MIKEEIINKGTELFQGKYDYSLLGEIKTKKEKFPIICPEHGVFYKDYESHIRKQRGCPECSGRKRHTNEEFIVKCKALEHTQEMNFDNCHYINYYTKVSIYCCHKDEKGVEHGEFTITPGHLLSGQGCPKCRYIKSASSKRRSIEEVVAAANEVHGHKYDYSLFTEYKNDRVKYPIICPEHGIFYQTMNNHIKAKQGCPTCGRIKCDEGRTNTTEEFIHKCNEMHNGKYDYSLVNYTKSSNYVDIICPIHGIFKQLARNHQHGQGCPECYREKSGVERELFEFVKSLLPNNTVEENNRTILDGKEIDVYVPSLKIGFEMNGLIWHSDRFDTDKSYHLLKTESALSAGVRLIHIFEDEWLNKKEICKSRIRNILGIIDNKISARKCFIREVSNNEAMLFLEENHLQGKRLSTINIGLFYNDELVEIMCFNQLKYVGEYEITRLCSKLNLTICGGASRLLKHFVKIYNPNKIISNGDRRWTVGSIYDKLNFNLTHVSNPRFFYVSNKKRYDEPNDDAVNKIYDCGCFCYEWSKK